MWMFALKKFFFIFLTMITNERLQKGFNCNETFSYFWNLPQCFTTTSHVTLYKKSCSNVSITFQLQSFIQNLSEIFKKAYDSFESLHADWVCNILSYITWTWILENLRILKVLHRIFSWITYQERKWILKPDSIHKCSIISKR